MSKFVFDLLRMRIVLITLVLTLFTFCKPVVQTMEPVKNMIQSEEDMEKNMGAVVEVKGIYKRMNLSKRPDKIVYASRVYLLLKDSSTLALEREDKGFRPEDEIKKFEDKHVCVTGRLNEIAPLWGDGTVASIVSRYLSDIQKIEAAE